MTLVGTRVTTSLIELVLMTGVWAWAGWRGVVCVVVMCVVVGMNRWWLARRATR